MDGQGGGSARFHGGVAMKTETWCRCGNSELLGRAAMA